MILRHSLLILLLALMAAAQPPNGLWDATIEINGLTIPFRFETSSKDGEIQGAFFNGDERVSSTSGWLRDGKLHLEFAHYSTVLDATLKDGSLEGTYGRAARGFNPFRATLSKGARAKEITAPDIAGVWEFPVQSPKGESAWRFIARQNGAEVSAAILRIDGDTGTLTGRYNGQHFELSHYSGARPNLLDVKPNADGTLTLTLNRKTEYIAYRSEVARSRALPQPADPATHTGIRNSSEPFAFSFPDLGGNLVSNTDARFKGKVVVVNITGSWCPNCHDEAPFLAELYRRYKGLGLEVVALSFEEEEQLKNPTRVRAFVREYGIEYPVLLAGQQSEVREKIHQAENLNAWPTTFFLGRDGRVHSVHVGFPSSASGEFYDKAKQEITATVEKLLTGSVRSAR